MMKLMLFIGLMFVILGSTYQINGYSEEYSLNKSIDLNSTQFNSSIENNTLASTFVDKTLKYAFDVVDDVSYAGIRYGYEHPDMTFKRILLLYVIVWIIVALWTPFIHLYLLINEYVLKRRRKKND